MLWNKKNCATTKSPTSPSIWRPPSAETSPTLWDIADSLGVTISFFFEGLASTTPADVAESEELPRIGASVQTGATDLMGDREAMDLVRTYYAIPETQRRRLFDLARVLSDVA